MKSAGRRWNAHFLTYELGIGCNHNHHSVVTTAQLPLGTQVIGKLAQRFNRTVADTFVELFQDGDSELKVAFARLTSAFGARTRTDSTKIFDSFFKTSDYFEITKKSNLINWIVSGRGGLQCTHCGVDRTACLDRTRNLVLSPNCNTAPDQRADSEISPCSIRTIDFGSKPQWNWRRAHKRNESSHSRTPFWLIFFCAKMLRCDFF